MLENQRQTVERAMSARGDRTAAVIVLAHKSPDMLATLVAFRALDEIQGVQEHSVVTGLCENVDGDVRAQAILRWPASASDAQIRLGITKVLDSTLKVALQGKGPMPTRYCWGDLGGNVDDQFVQQVAPNLALSYEQAEMAWKVSHPASFLVFVRQEQGEIKWSTQFVITPDEVVMTMAPALLWSTAEAQYEREFGVCPKATMCVPFPKRKTIRETAGELSKVIQNLAEWSSPYESNGQAGFWFFDELESV
jgi:hypothetical protein